MKQNGQWLSQVRTRSNTALASSTPSGAPVGLVDHDRARARPAADLELDARPVDLELVRDDVAEILAVDREHLVARRARPRRAAGDPGATVRTRAGGHRASVGVGTDE